MLVSFLPCEGNRDRTDTALGGASGLTVPQHPLVPLPRPVPLERPSGTLRPDRSEAAASVVRAQWGRLSAGVGPPGPPGGGVWVGGGAIGVRGVLRGATLAPWGGVDCCGFLWGLGAVFFWGFVFFFFFPRSQIGVGPHGRTTELH